MALFDSWRRWFSTAQRGVSRRLAAFRRVPIAIQIRALPAGRVSHDTEQTYLPAAWMIQAPDNYESNWQLMNLSTKGFEQIEPARLLEMLTDLSPEVSRALWDFLRMCGYEYKVTAFTPGTEDQDMRGQAAVDAFVALLNSRSTTLDVIVGRLFMGAFMRGALCSELVLDARGRKPLDLATPDPASIRFRQRSDAERGIVWAAGQWQAGKFVSLERTTFRYVPIDPMFGSPYGRPMAAPALFTTLFLLGLLHDLKRVIQQQGYPRLDLAIDTKALIDMAPQLMSGPEQFNAFVASLVREVEQAYSALQPDDAYIHTDVIKVNGPVGTADGSLAGIDGLITALERMAVRALKTMPLMMGITESTGDVQSNRQWEIHVAGIRSVQKYASTVLGQLFQLALEAQGIQATVKFAFTELRSSERLRDAQAETMEISNAAAKRDQGWISQDQAATDVTGSPAVAPAPSRTTGAQPASQPALVQGNTDGMQLNSHWVTELREAQALVQAALEAMGTNRDN